MTARARAESVIAPVRLFGFAVVSQSLVCAMPQTSSSHPPVHGPASSHPPSHGHKTTGKTTASWPEQAEALTSYVIPAGTRNDRIQSQIPAFPVCRIVLDAGTLVERLLVARPPLALLRMAGLAYTAQPEGSAGFGRLVARI